MRLLYLDADPPEHLNWAWGEWVDPGSYSYNARNKVLFGKWELDDWNLMYVTPIPHIITFFIFKLFGVGFWQNNFVPALFSCGSLFIFYFLLKQVYSLFYVYAGCVLLGLNYLMITYARIGNRISEMIFFLLLAALFWQKGFKKNIYFYLAGIASMCAFLTKPSMVDYFIINIVALIVVSLTEQNLYSYKKVISNIFLYVFGIITIVIPWYIFLYLPHKRIYEIFLKKDIDYRIPFSLNSLIINIWKAPIGHYFTIYLPVIYFFSLLFIIIKIFAIIDFIKMKRIDDKEKDLNRLEILALSWFIGDYLFNSIINYKPLRFFIDMIPAIIILFISFIRYLWNNKGLTITRLGFVKSIAFLVWVFLTFQYYINEHIYAIYEMTHLSLFAYFRKHAPYNYYYGYMVILIISMICFIIFYFFRLINNGKKIKVCTYLTKGVCLIIFIISIFFQLNLYYEWLSKHRSYKIIDYSRFLLYYVPKGPISGNIAPMLCFENEFKAYLIYKDRNNWYNRPFELYGITHMQMANPHDERDGYFYGFPEVMQKAQVEVSFPLRGRMEELWARFPIKSEYLTMTNVSENKVKIKNSDSKLFHYALIIKKDTSEIKEMIPLAPNEEKLLDYKYDEITFQYADFDFEFEKTKREVGMPIFDLEASNNIAVKSEKGKRNIIFSKWFPLPKNRYMLVIRLKNENKNLKYAFSKIKLYDKNDNLMKEMLFEISNSNGEYKEITASFTNPIEQAVSIEIYNPEIEKVYFDILQIVPIGEKYR